MAGGSEGNRRELEVVLVVEGLEVLEGHWANGRHSLAGGLGLSSSSSSISSFSCFLSPRSKPMIWAMENWSLAACFGDILSPSSSSSSSSLMLVWGPASTLVWE